MLPFFVENSYPPPLDRRGGEGGGRHGGEPGGLRSAGRRHRGDSISLHVSPVLHGAVHIQFAAVPQPSLGLLEDMGHLMADHLAAQSCVRVKLAGREVDLIAPGVGFGADGFHVAGFPEAQVVNGMAKVLFDAALHLVGQGQGPAGPP